MSTSPSRSPMDHEEWAAALSRWFFRSEYSGSHVMYLVDDDALGEAYGGDSEEARLSLVSAVRAKLRLRNHRQLFADIEHTTRLWKAAGGDEPPPCLPLLAVAVLAATRMARSIDRAGNNYYGPFIELLDLDVEEHDVVYSYGESVPDLWEMLRWWLDHKHRGELGLSTIVADTHFTRIGYADSQTLFASSDRDKLTRFLRWLGLRPGEAIGDDELLAYFRLWTGGSGCELTLGAQTMLEEGERPRQLLGILKRVAAGWQGVSRDDQGRAEGTILITLRSFPRPELKLVAERPPGFPAELRVGSGAQMVVLDATDAVDGGWYRIPLELSGAMLRDGIRLEFEGRVLRLPAAQIHVLHKRPELGRWASVDRLRPGEAAWLLVHEGMARRVEEFLCRNARKSDETDTWAWANRPGLVPTGWRLMRNVVVDAASDESGDGLRALTPRFQNRLSLQGGLPLPRGTGVYLTEGEPDLWLPEGGDSRLEVTVDDLDQTVDGSILQLRRIGLAEGPHEARVGPISRRFSTQRSIAGVVPAVEGAIGHSVLRGAHAVTAQTLSATHVDNRTEEVLIVGASITEAIEQDPAASRDCTGAQRPIVLPVRSQGCILLGALPGQITWVPPAPTKPAWMDIAALDYRVFEYSPSHEVVWVLTEWQMAPRQRVRVRESTPPYAVPSERSDPMKAWATTILEWEPPQEPAVNALWESYMDVAEVVLGQ
jgi:hypothetical protein